MNPTQGLPAWTPDDDAPADLDADSPFYVADAYDDFDDDDDADDDADDVEDD